MKMVRYTDEHNWVAEDVLPPPYRIVSEPDPGNGDRLGIWPLVGVIAVGAAIAAILVGVWA